MLKHVVPPQSTKDYAGANIHVSVEDPKLQQVDMPWRKMQLMKDHAGAVHEGHHSGAGDQCEEQQRGAMVFLIKDKHR